MEEQKIGTKLTKFWTEKIRELTCELGNGGSYRVFFSTTNGLRVVAEIV